MFYLLKLITPITFNVIGAVLGGAAVGLGSAIGGIMGANSSAKASKEIAKMQIDWERERATHAHQWETQDLEAAGLNKVLTVNGTGANTSGINPPMPDTSGYAQAGNAISTAYNTAAQVQATQNDTNRTINETKETNSNLSLKRTQIELMLDEKLTNAVKRGLMSEKQATEIKNRAKLQSDIELAQSQELLNMQIREKTSAEIDQINTEIKLLEKELELHPEKKERLRIENEISEKENKLYYLRETVNEITKIGGLGFSMYGAYKANQALSAYKANQHREQYSEIFNKHGEIVGGKRIYYR